MPGAHPSFFEGWDSARVGMDGSSSKMAVGDWAADDTSTTTGDALNHETIQTQAGFIPRVRVDLITNADQGVLLALQAFTPGYDTYLNIVTTPVSCDVSPNCEQSTVVAQNSIPAGTTINLLTVSGGSVTANVQEPDSRIFNLQPVLQAQDGTFFGLVDYDYGRDDYLASFDKSGNVKWSVGAGPPKPAPLHARVPRPSSAWAGLLTFVLESQ